MLFYLIILLFLVSISYSDIQTQTDWSGGDGVPGPVTEWDNSYSVADNIDTGSSLYLLSSDPLEHTVDGNFSGAYSVYATDVDGDGDNDILGAALFPDDITWWENTDGAGTAWTEHTVDGNFDGARSVYATDVDGDGYTDILGAAFNDDDITWWELNNFSDGYLESSILDAGTVDTWQSFSSNEEEPAGTSVGFQFRSSDDSSDMGEWSDTSFTVSTNLSDILADSTNFLQYRAILQTTDPSITPVLNNVTIFYITYVSIDDVNNEDITNWALTPTANPSYGSPSIQVSVPQTEIVNLLLYDATGRLVAEHSQELTTGQHAFYFTNLCSGVYFCRIRAGDFIATDQFVVLE